MTANTSLQSRFEDILRQLRELVLDGARMKNGLRLHVMHGDSYWTVLVHPDGSTEYDNYARDARGPRGTVGDLSAWELVQLAGQLVD